MTETRDHVQHEFGFPDEDCARAGPEGGRQEPADFTADAVTEPERAPPANRLWWGALGFVAGALFWHLVGFWSFVGAVAFNEDPHTSVTRPAFPLAVESAIPQGAQRVEPAGTPADENCSAHALDRATGEVTIAPCHWSPLTLAEGTSSARQDLAVADIIERRLIERFGIDPSRIETGSIAQDE